MKFLHTTVSHENQLYTSWYFYSLNNNVLAYLGITAFVINIVLAVLDGQNQTKSIQTVNADSELQQFNCFLS